MKEKVFLAAGVLCLAYYGVCGIYGNFKISVLWIWLLTCLLYTSFDLCGPLYPLPNLECGERLAASMEGSSRYYLYLTQLQKGYNRVMEYCGQILELL